MLRLGPAQATSNHFVQRHILAPLHKYPKQTGAQGPVKLGEFNPHFSDKLPIWRCKGVPRWQWADSHRQAAFLRSECEESGSYHPSIMASVSSL